MKKSVVIGVVLVAVLAAGIAWWLTHGNEGAHELVLHGNVDLRQVELAFNNSERITEVLVQEGDRVHGGEVVARVDTRRLRPQMDEAAARAAAQQQALARLKNGSRPEEIAQARANVVAAQADAANARAQYARLKKLAVAVGTMGRAVSLQDVDNAKAALDMAEARLQVNAKALDLAVIGPRREDIAEAHATFQAEGAQLALLRQELADAELKAPTDAVVQSRIMEPGEMVSPQKPVLTLAITDPKWVRAYVSEVDLGRLHPGMKAEVGVDSFPERRFAGWVGFISPVAEFTPKSVETEDLRPSLVYEVRVFVKDPSDDLRLGMPATVYFPGAATPASESSATMPATEGQ